MEKETSEFKRNIGYYYSYFVNQALISPDIVQITLTYRCNLRCKMCNIRNIKAENEISFTRIKSLIDEAAEWGVPELLLLGGEPFLHSELMNFIHYAGSKGLKTTIVTNGTLIDDKMARIIADAPLTQLVISLDGARAKTHDSLRGIAGSYDKAINAIRLVDKYKRNMGKTRFDSPLLIIPITLMNNNLDEMWKYVVLANRLPVSALGFQPVVIDNANLKYSDTNHAVWIPPHRLKLLDKMVDKVIRYKKIRKEKQPVIGNTPVHLEAIKKYFRNVLTQQDIKCYIGYTRVVISPDGNTSLCGESIGNVNTHSMQDMWRSDLARQARNRIKKCEKPCLQFCTLRPESELKEALNIFLQKADFRNCNSEVKKLIRENIVNIFSQMRCILKQCQKIGTDQAGLESEIDSAISMIDNLSVS